MIKKNLILLLLLLMPSLLIASPVQIEVTGTYLYSPVDGYVQIPLGGQPDTSTPQKPSFSDLGVNNDGFWNTTLALHKNHWSGFITYQGETLKGNSTISYNLITHGVSFPTGTAIIDNTQFNALTEGAYYTFQLSKWSIAPMLAGSTVFFDYTVSSSSDSTDRKFSQFSIRPGISLTYNFTQKLSAQIVTLDSIPGLLNSQFYWTDCQLNYQFFKHANYIGTVFGGLAYQKISDEDSQEMPNHIQMINSPIGFVGLSIMV